MKLNEYGISEYAKNPYPLDALVVGLQRFWELELPGVNFSPQRSLNWYDFNSHHATGRVAQPLCPFFAQPLAKTRLDVPLQ